MNAKLAGLMVCLLASAAAPTISIAQTLPAKSSPAAAKAPRNGFNQPDLEGVWSNTTLTHMERSPQFGDHLVLTPAEAATIEGDRSKLLANGAKPTDPKATTQEVNKTCDLPGFPATADCAYNVGWTDAGNLVMRVNGQPRSSLITFPANGRVPWKPGRAPKSAMGEGKSDNPENRSLPERCLVSQNITAGAVLNPTLYNNTYLIRQGPNTVSIVVEMSHDVRTIRLNAKHENTPKWFGDSIGHYEGDTLVVETTNFHPEQLARNSPQMKLLERFTRKDKTHILYQFRIEDPEAYTEPWGGEYEFYITPGPQYEYACHEGNYGLEGILSGARAQEKSPLTKTASVETPEDPNAQ
jgi:hypothetical protein